MRSQVLQVTKLSYLLLSPHWKGMENGGSCSRCLELLYVGVKIAKQEVTVKIHTRQALDRRGSGDSGKAHESLQRAKEKNNSTHVRLRRSMIKEERKE